jgi:phosphoribosylanthranilate isomerase
MVKVKICGITNIEDALMALDLGADALGFVFAFSPRRVSETQAYEIIRKLPPFAVSVGVFVNEQLAGVKQIIKKCNLNVVQFHGDESPDYCRRFEEVKIIKAFRIKDNDSLKTLLNYQVDGVLLDTYIEEKAGGTGVSFDWNLASSFKDCGKSIILSGGLSADNVEEAIRTVKPYAVDVSTGVETAPGKKDPKLVKEFIHRAKRASMAWGEE